MLPAVRIAVLFRISGWQHIPFIMDEEQLEFIDAIRSIPLTFIMGSTSSLCGERVVLASHPLHCFQDTSMWHVLVAGTDNGVSSGALFVICPWAAGSLWQSDWDLHSCSTALWLRSVSRGLKVGLQAHEEGWCCPATAATSSLTSTSSITRAQALARICSRVMYSIVEDPRSCRLTGPGSPDTKAQLSHRSEVFSSIRRARSCRSPKYSSTVSPRA